MKYLKLFTLLTLTVILLGADLLPNKSSNDPKNIQPVQFKKISSAMNKITSEDQKRSSSFNRIISELEFYIAHPEAFIRISGYNVYPE